jgi:hypothetical protein
MTANNPPQNKSAETMICPFSFLLVPWVVVRLVPAAVASCRPDIGDPHFGQVGAREETWCPQSGQLMRAMTRSVLSMWIGVISLVQRTEIVKLTMRRSRAYAESVAATVATGIGVPESTARKTLRASFFVLGFHVLWDSCAGTREGGRFRCRYANLCTSPTIIGVMVVISSSTEVHHVF